MWAFRKLPGNADLETPPASFVLVGRYDWHRGQDAVPEKHSPYRRTPWFPLN